jgi:hypothetical protein
VRYFPLKSKRGAAIESALTFMIIIFSLCFLLTSLALWGYYQIKLASVRTEVYVEVEQIGEDFVAYLGQTEAPDFASYLEQNGISHADFICRESAEGDVFELSVKKVADADGQTVLYVKAERTQSGITLLEWKEARAESN